MRFGKVQPRLLVMTRAPSDPSGNDAGYGRSAEMDRAKLLARVVTLAARELLARVARTALDRLQISGQFGDPRLDRVLVLRLGIEACTPYRNVADHEP
jgi:hypothetical protein